MIERKTKVAKDASAQFNTILLELVQAINEGHESTDHFVLALEKVRDFFLFGNVFIYESDPQKRLILHEHSSTYEHDTLPPSFNLDELFTSDEVNYIAKNSWCCATKNLNKDELQKKLCGFFKQSSVFIVFVIDEEGAIVGCLGMTDKRNHEPLTDEEYFQVKTVLGLIAHRSLARTYKHRLEYTSATLKNIMDHLGFDIYVNDFYTHEMLYANESMAEPYGGWEHMQGKPCYEALYEDQHEECEYCPKKELIDDEGKPSKIYVWDYQRPFDGTWFRVICAAFKWVDGRLAQVISSTNINNAKQNELLVHNMAFHDQLTGIGNRRKLESDFEEILKDPVRVGSGLSVLFLDLDGFKKVNDTYGHNGGDAVLKHISSLFQENSLTKDRCYRYGGDEFIFLLENVTEEETKLKGLQILELLEIPLEIDDDSVVCKGSFGIARYPDDDVDFWKLLDKADNEMYRRKQRGNKNYV